MPAKQTVRRSVAMTPQLHARLCQLADRQPRPVSAAALIRRAIREYLDRQEDITGSRAHFRKTFRERVDTLEAALTWRLDVLLALLAHGLAALDWVAAEDRPQKPVVQAAHWYRAQQIAEVWRASAHRLLYDLGESEEARLEARILKLLAGRRDGLSVRSIYRALRSPRKPVIEALKALEQDGQVVGEVVKNSGPGRPSERYWLVGEYGA